MLYRDPETIEAMFGINHKVHLDPMPQARHRYNGHNLYDPNAYHKTTLRNLVIAGLNNNGITADMLPLTTSYVSIEMTFFVSCPSGHFVNGNRSNNIQRENQHIMPTASGDIDNYVKLLLDVLDGIFFQNDSNVVKIAATKLYCIEARGRTVYKVRPYVMNSISLIDDDDNQNEI